MSFVPLMPMRFRSRGRLSYPSVNAHPGLSYPVRVYRSLIGSRKPSVQPPGLHAERTRSSKQQTNLARPHQKSCSSVLDQRSSLLSMLVQRCSSKASRLVLFLHHRWNGSMPRMLPTGHRCFLQTYSQFPLKRVWNKVGRSTPVVTGIQYHLSTLEHLPTTRPCSHSSALPLTR